MNAGVNANVSLEPTSASQSNNNINNNIIINRREDGKEDIVITRDITVEEDKALEVKFNDVTKLILETYAQILLDQDKALLSNIITKNSIIVPYESLVNIVKCCVGPDKNVQIYIDEDVKCCAVKASPIRSIDAIKVVSESGEVVTDFKTVYNKEWNELVNVYHLNLKYVVV